MPTSQVKPGEAWDSVKQGKPIEYIKVQTIITFPQPNAKIAPGKLVVRGKAFSGTGTIQKVELSTDAGQTWLAANVSPAKDYA